MRSPVSLQPSKQVGMRFIIAWRCSSSVMFITLRCCAEMLLKLSELSHLVLSSAPVLCVHVACTYSAKSGVEQVSIVAPFWPNQI